MKTAIAIVGLALFAAPTMACEMCRDATPTRTATDPAPPTADASLGFNSSIYFMLASLGVAGGLVVRTVKRAVQNP